MRIKIDMIYKIENAHAYTKDHGENMEKFRDFFHKRI